MSKIKKYSLISVISVVLGLLLVFGSTTLNAEPQTGDQGTAEAVGEIYLDGKAGNDDNDGKSTATAVKTFAKAKELASNSTKIIVTGTTAIEGDINLSDLSAEVVRADNFNGYLFEVPSGKTATLTNIVIDGNSENNKTIEKSLVTVKSGAILNINDGVVLRNNYIKDITNKATLGGAINASGATINMTSGVIEKNQATRGGGIYLGGSTLNFSGGVIQNNESKRVFDSDVNQYYSAGAGIIATLGSTINMSDNAKILNNKSGENGGGISVGSRVVESGNNTLNMTGGVIDGNLAGTSGGGIFVQAKYFSGGLGRAYISGGSITNNTMDNSGATESLFGGGGIYVNGATEEYGKNGELYLTNALIYNNESQFQGAGYAACPITITNIYVTNGVAIYDNKASQGNEIFIYSSMKLGPHSGHPEYDIADRMLGGALYNWQKEDGSFLKPEEHKGKLEIEGQSVLLHTAEQANDLAKKLGKVIISGNKSATRGGGIGSNGTVIFGVEKDLTEIAVSKVWDDNDNKDKTRPESIEVQLIAKLKGSNEEFVVETRTIDAKAEWKTVFKNLPKENNGVELEYSVKEKDITGYDSKISGNAEDGFTIENKPTPTTTTTTTEATTSTSTTEATTSTTTTETTTSYTTGTTAPTTSGTEPVTSPTTTPKVPPTTGERVEISMGVSLLLLAVAGVMLAVRKRRED